MNNHAEDNNTTKPGTRLAWADRLKQILRREPKNRNQLVELLKDAESRDLLDSDARSMIEGVLKVSELKVRDIMVPRSQIIVIEHDKLLKELLPIIIESAHSRFPVIGENRDEVLGVLLAKDLLKYAFSNSNISFNIKDILRKTFYIPESKRLDALLKDFRANHNHMAIVVDEYGGISGLVTIENVLEQIVGNIEDEHDVEEDALIRKRSDNEYIVNALTPIEEFNKYFKMDFRGDEFDTIGGFVIKNFSRLPKNGEMTYLGNLQVKVLSADKRRLRLLQFTVPESRNSE